MCWPPRQQRCHFTAHLSSTASYLSFPPPSCWGEPSPRRPGPVEPGTESFQPAADEQDTLSHRQPLRYADWIQTNTLHLSCRFSYFHLRGFSFESQDPGAYFSWFFNKMLLNFLPINLAFDRAFMHFHLLSLNSPIALIDTNLTDPWCSL